LFGHEKGAFTGAIAQKKGKLENAQGGTVFLDEIGELPVTLQAKLLRVLQEREFERVGGTHTLKLDIRLLAATNRDLAAEARRGSFREDLFHRLNVVALSVPPLRDRRDDIPVIASRFVSGAAERHNKRINGIDAAAIELLIRFDWPGNVRQLRNEIERSVALAREGETITPRHLSASLRGEADVPRASRVAPTSRLTPLPTPSGDTGEAQNSSRPLREARAEFEAKYISEVLRHHQFNVSHAAQALGISRPALQEKMKTYRLR
jgi:transcriptional regulator with PAS, ATPase and Fis domain